MFCFFYPVSPCPSPRTLTASSLGTKSRCPIPRRPITLQKESAEGWLLWAPSSAFPSPSSTALRTAGSCRWGVRAGIGGGEGGGDGGGVGQGEGEGRSRSGARVADDSSVSSERHSGFLSWRKDWLGAERLVCLGEQRAVLRSVFSLSGWVLVNKVTDWGRKLILPHQTVSQQTDVQDASSERNKETLIGTNNITAGIAQASKAVHLGTRQFGQ